MERNADSAVTSLPTAQTPAILILPSHHRTLYAMAVNHHLCLTTTNANARHPTTTGWEYIVSHAGKSLSAVINASTKHSAQVAMMEMGLSLTQ